MAGFGAIFDVGQTVVNLLNDRRKLLGTVVNLPETFLINNVSIGQFSKDANPPTESMTLACYRVLPSSHHRPQTPTRGTQRPSRLSIDLHFLLTVWAKDLAIEQTMLAWAMFELHRHPVFDQSLLNGGAGIWDRDEIIHFVPEPITHEAMFRIWDSFMLKYRLSATYCARVIQITAGIEPDHLPVVRTKFGHADAGTPELEDAL